MNFNDLFGRKNLFILIFSCLIFALSLSWMHSSVGRALDSKSKSHQFKSGCVHFYTNVYYLFVKNVSNGVVARTCVVSHVSVSPNLPLMRDLTGVSGGCRAVWIDQSVYCP